MHLPLALLNEILPPNLLLIVGLALLAAGLWLRSHATHSDVAIETKLRAQRLSFESCRRRREAYHAAMTASLIGGALLVFAATLLLLVSGPA